MQQITASQLAQTLRHADRKPLLLDVREPFEFRYCHIAGSINIPMSDIFQEHSDLDPELETVVICHHGIRSAQIAAFLAERGFAHVINLAGGIAAWANEIDPSMPRY